MDNSLLAVRDINHKYIVVEKEEINVVRYGTIGTNYITDLFANGASVCKDLAYEAVYSRRQETGRAFADKYGVKKVYTDLEEMAEDPEIDGIYIASPNCFHRDQALLMLEHGKHVLCENRRSATAGNGIL